MILRRIERLERVGSQEPFKTQVVPEDARNCILRARIAKFFRLS